jgi:two-component system, OmpR family, response regulator
MTQERLKVSERRLLILGPDPTRRTGVGKAMHVADFDVVEAASNAKATRLVNESVPAGVICVWPAKGVHGGTELLSHLRSRDERMLIVVLGLTLVASNVREALQAGADLCLPATYNTASLAVHMQIGIRRRRTVVPPKKAPLPKRVHVGDLTLDIPAHQVWRSDVEITLTRIEFRLLSALVEHSGNVMSKAILFEECWRRRDDPHGEEGDHLVEVHVAQLRKKLHRHGDPILRTIYGVGYVLRPLDP